MGQKDKAREIVAERYHFHRTVSADRAAILEACDRVAAGTRRRLGGSFKKTSSCNQGIQDGVTYELMGPGSLVSIATIVISMAQLDTGIKVVCHLDNFLFQKRSMGMKPTINGGAQLEKFVAGVKAELDAMSSV